MNNKTPYYDNTTPVAAITTNFCSMHNAILSHFFQLLSSEENHVGTSEGTRKMTAIAYVVERSSNLECSMSDNVNSDNTHEDLQRLIVSITSASQTPS